MLETFGEDPKRPFDLCGSRSRSIEFYGALFEVEDFLMEYVVEFDWGGSWSRELTLDVRPAERFGAWPEGFRVGCPTNGDAE